MLPRARVWSTWCTAAWRTSSAWQTASWRCCTLMGRERWRSISGPFGVPMTRVRVAAYFENFLGPLKPVKASDGDYYTLGTWRVGMKLPWHQLSRCPAPYSPPSSLRMPSKCLLCGWLWVKCWQGPSVVLDFPGSWILGWKHQGLHFLSHPADAPHIISEPCGLRPQFPHV